MARKKQTLTLDTGEQNPLEAMSAHAPKEPEPKPEIDQDDLLKRIAGLEERAERAEKTNLALMSAPPPAPNYQLNAAPDSHRTTLPDPLTDSEGYADALSRRIAEQTRAEREQADKVAAEARAKDNQVSALWDTFGERYPDLAEDEDLVEVAARKVLTDMAKRGVDTNKYMTAASDQFLSDVAQRMKTDFAKLYADEPAPQANRTGGIAGGGPSAVRPKGADGKPTTTMTEDLQAIQKRDGYY